MKTPTTPTAGARTASDSQGRTSPPQPCRVTAAGFYPGGRCCHCTRSCLGPGKAGQPSSDPPCQGTAGTCDVPAFPISRLSACPITSSPVCKLLGSLVPQFPAPKIELLTATSCLLGSIVTEQWGRAEHPGRGRQASGEAQSPVGPKERPRFCLGAGKLLSNSAHLLGGNSLWPSCSLRVGKREKERPPSLSSHGMTSFLFLTSS